MVFSSAIFLLAFLPVTFILYYVLPGRMAKNVLLLLASLLFYSFGEPVFVFLMIFSVLLNYIFGLFAAKGGTKGRAAVALAAVVNIGILCVFKYTDFIIGNINMIPGIKLPFTGIVMPIGISFFTFQALSYVVDTYRDNTLVQKNFFNLLLYVSFFPQLIAGPIVRYEDIAKELYNRKADAKDIAEGFRRFIFGLAKKLIVSNAMAGVSDLVFDNFSGSQYNVVVCWLGAIFYTLHIYYDFSAYSDMAIGLGRMFGFHFRENFMHPLSAKSIQDFWRRWHISLSTWFKEYVYIPLGGNRKGSARRTLNKFIVFFLTGLWHGAGWNFVIWGMIHGITLTVEDFIKEKTGSKKDHSVIGRIYTLFIVVIAFVFFRAETFSGALAFLKGMFTGFDFASVSVLSTMITPWFIFVLAIALLFSCPLLGTVKKLTVERGGKLGRVFEAGSYAITLALLAFCLLALSTADFNPFIYFRF
ncbi:MAG: MBOAT family O-acyltransferase [Clostridia bacterium]|nr:MBOAT family O-acyltransferase [Clostridia bacterium]